MVRSPTDSGESAATQGKAVSPEISLLAGGQGLVCPEASIVTGDRRRVCHGLPGSQAAAGSSMDGTERQEQQRTPTLPNQRAIARLLDQCATGRAWERSLPCKEVDAQRSHRQGGNVFRSSSHRTGTPAGQTCEGESATTNANHPQGRRP